MGLPSLYESGPEEEEIFGLTRPMDDLPDGTSDDISDGGADAHGIKRLPIQPG